VDDPDVRCGCSALCEWLRAAHHYNADRATGALVYLNDQEVGRTPFTRNFIWYGTYDVEIRKEGFASIKTTAKVWAPWWQWVPFDLLTEPLPLTDNHQLKYTLHPPNERDVEPDLIIKRGEQLAEELESTRKPLTSKTPSHAHHAQAATQPAKH